MNLIPSAYLLGGYGHPPQPQRPPLWSRLTNTLRNVVKRRKEIKLTEKEKEEQARRQRISEIRHQYTNPYVFGQYDRPRNEEEDRQIVDFQQLRQLNRQNNFSEDVSQEQFEKFYNYVYPDQMEDEDDVESSEG